MDRVPTGVVTGRFQPLHIGHMEYLLAAKERCNMLVVGITNPDPDVTEPHETDSRRAEPEANPFTYYERLCMTRDSLLEAGLERSEFEIVPCPINVPHRIPHYVPRGARFFVTIYDDWGRAKSEILQSLPAEVEILWERDMADRAATGAAIRTAMAEHAPWEHLVPGAVATMLRRPEFGERLRSMPQ